tara:strand:- start:449 stop:1306 length:858 start_codon:yes stop_codon:yes gene_type:complete
MIIHHKEDFSEYDICIFKSLKYSDTFTFIPIQLNHKNTNQLQKCIFQTPLLFSPFGIQTTKNNKKIIDVSFQNKENDNSLKQFEKTLTLIYKRIHHKYSKEYNINHFMKETDFENCLRLKITSDIQIYDENKSIVTTIQSFTYGYFIIHLHGLWLNKNEIWFQWDLLQAKVLIPTYLKEYSFIDEIQNKNLPSKYDKMIKMGVPEAAVQRQKMLDGKIPPPPPPPGISLQTKSYTIPKIQASDLQSVTLKKGKPLPKKKINKNTNFEPPSIEELQTTLSKLKSIK